MQIDKEFYRKLIRIGVPIMFQELMLAAVAAGDAFMLSQSSQDAMAAVSLATQVQFIQNMAMTASTGAGAILGAQYFGKKDLRTVNDIFIIMLRFSAMISFVFFIACVFFPTQLMHVYTQEADLIAIGADYLRIAGFSYLLTGLTQSYLTTMKVTEHVTVSAIISTGTVVLNLILNGLLIFGWFGLSPMGAKGAALATTIARAAEFGAVIIISFCPGYMQPNMKRFFLRDKLLTRDFLKCGLPLCGGALFWGIGYSGYTAIIGHMGKAAAAANSITAVVRDLFCCFSHGLSSAAGIMVGNELGAGDLEKGRIYGARFSKLSIWSGLFCMAAILALTPVLLNFTHLTGEAADLMKGMMIIMSFYMIGRNITTVVICGVFIAGGDTLFDIYSLAVMMWGLALPLAFLGAFVFGWPVLAVYACTCLDEVGKLPWVYIHYKKYKWVKDLTREREELE